MKKSFAIAALTLGAIVLGSNTVQAQEAVQAQVADQTSATTTATIELDDIISITAVNKPVAFVYKTAYDYNNDQKKEKATTLTVTSSKEFNIKVNAGGTHFTSASGENAIPVDVLTINAISGVKDAGSVNLKNEVKTLVAKSAGGSQLTWDIDYTIPKEKSQSTDILGKEKGTYTQTITYTVTN